MPEVLGVIFVIGVLAAPMIAALMYEGKRQSRRKHPKVRSAVVSSKKEPLARAHVATPERVLHGRCHVVDGDTIMIRDISIRIGGIDAPELDHPYGMTAKWALVKLCKGQAIRAEVIEDDHFGRVVGRCFLPDGRDLAAEMVRLGHAVDWAKYSGGRYRHLEVPGIRKRLWRCDARQKGQMIQ